MADIKEQASRALAVITSDTIGIPNISLGTLTGTATATTANKLVNSAATFVTAGIRKGAIVYNTTDSTVMTVTAVDSQTTLSVSANLMASGETYVIYPEATKDCAIYIGGSGNLKVVTSGGDIVTYSNVLAGSFLPINIKQVYTTGTTATNILAQW
jgi:hypothetical protein